jgi:hypothetical protein
VRAGTTVEPKRDPHKVRGAKDLLAVTAVAASSSPRSELVAKMRDLAPIPVADRLPRPGVVEATVVGGSSVTTIEAGKFVALSVDAEDTKHVAEVVEQVFKPDDVMGTHNLV